jgi:diguanylate cyclase (GGDEF)-like protein/PAS domain S-box-containing protein
MSSHALVEAPDAGTAPAILIVDDNAAKRLALRAMLAPLGHAVVEADSGRAALRAVMHRAFAMILMDVRMPTLDGYETAKLCRRRSGGRPTPIMFVTALARSEDDTASAYASGAVDFISAPIDPEVLRAKVTAFVDLFRQSEELRTSLEAITGLNAALRDSEVRTQAVLDNVADGIFILNEGGLIESVNRSASRLFGYRTEELVGQPFTSMIAPRRRSEFRDLDAAEAQLPTPRDPPGRAIETLGRRQDRSTFAMELERSEMQHANRRLTLLCVRDISERKAHTEALEHQALHDALTGLANRTLFSEHLARALARAKRTGESRAVLVMDIDGFKQVNDTLGHDRGDALLGQVAERLTSTLRDTDTIARLGGDEFGILAGDASDLAAAASMAWKIQEMCEPGFIINGEVVHASASVGIALFPEHGSSTEDLLHRADLAMYVAKRSGSHHAIYDAAQDRQKVNHLALLLDLRQCVAREELVLHYQPKIDLLSGVIYGVEALVRWRHPTRGLLLPASFVPDVERTDLIASVTRWVLNAALRQQRTWSENGVDLNMAVNVSARSLRRSSGLPETVAELTETWGTPPDRLTLELTEGALIETAAPSVLTRLHDMGERLSIDDFGTGYSSLAYLQRLPVDELKVDKSFVTSLATTGDDAIIVRSTIDLAHNLGLRVVAEGVEDENVLKTLVEYGCDAAQGYLFGRPVPVGELDRWLTESPYGVRPVVRWA